MSVPCLHQHLITASSHWRHGAKVASTPEQRLTPAIAGPRIARLHGGSWPQLPPSSHCSRASCVDRLASCSSLEGCLQSLAWGLQAIPGRTLGTSMLGPQRVRGSAPCSRSLTLICARSMITTDVFACMQGTLDASQQPGVRELMGDRTELRISVWAAPDNSVTVDQVAKWTWQQHGQLWKVGPYPPCLGQAGCTGLDPHRCSTRLSCTEPIIKYRPP